MARREAAARANVAQRFLGEKTTGIQVAEVRVSANLSLHLTAAAIPVSRGITVMQAALAGELVRSAARFGLIDRSNFDSIEFGVV